MRILLATIVLASSIYATELIYISKDITEQTLQQLVKKYKQDLILNDSHAYLAPSECLTSRYFGGESENKVVLPRSKTYATPVTITQEVFEADDTQEIEEAILKQVVIQKISGTTPKAFVGDKEGHLFGGESEIVLDLSAQRSIVKEVKVVELRTVSKTKKEEPTQPIVYKHPTCKLLDDGSGYKLFGTQNPSSFKDGILAPISGDIVLFN